MRRPETRKRRRMEPVGGDRLDAAHLAAPHPFVNASGY
jgi:hypothetical protein